MKLQFSNPKKDPLFAFLLVSLSILSVASFLVLTHKDVDKQTFTCEELTNRMLNTNDGSEYDGKKHSYWERRYYTDGCYIKQ